MSPPETPAAPEAQPEDPGTQSGAIIAGRYRVEKLLGEGGMGAVYLVQHTGIRKRLALKLLRSDLLAVPAVLSRFEREAMAAAHLDHPNVAAATDYGRTEGGRFYLVLEYVEGQELRAALDKEKGPLPLARALFIVRQIASALARAHEIGVVHRDLKPENIMLVQREGHGDFVKVLDFGLAQVPRRITEEPLEDPSQETSASKISKLTKVGDIFGTPAYMAPEQTIGQNTDVRTDLYSLGIILYELLAGVRPFLGKSMLVLMQQHLSTPPPPLSESAPTTKIPAEVEALVQRLLAKDPDARIQRPQELLAEIDRITAIHKLSWPPGTAAAASISHSLDPVAGQRVSSISRALSALRTQAGNVLPSSKIQGALARLQAQIGVPRWQILVGIAVLIAVPLALGLRALVADSVRAPIQGTNRATPQPPVGEISLAPQSAFDAAVAQGLDAVERLSSRYPADARIQRTLVRSYTSQRRHIEAMQRIRKLAALEPGVGSDGEVVKSIVAAVQADPDSVEAVATLLEQDLGEAGVDLLYDLTVKQTGARWKPRINQSLTKPEVLAKASPVTRLLLDLRSAKRCEQKRDLLPRVAQEGDKRALVQLKGLQATDGCGVFELQDCWPCLRKTTALQDAITALEARTKEAKQP